MLPNKIQENERSVYDLIYMSLEKRVFLKIDGSYFFHQSYLKRPQFLGGVFEGTA